MNHHDDSKPSQGTINIHYSSTCSLFCLLSERMVLPRSVDKRSNIFKIVSYMIGKGSKYGLQKCEIDIPSTCGRISASVPSVHQSVNMLCHK